MWPTILAAEWRALSPFVKHVHFFEQAANCFKAQTSVTLDKNITGLSQCSTEGWMQKYLCEHTGKSPQSCAVGHVQVEAAPCFGCVMRCQQQSFLLPHLLHRSVQVMAPSIEDGHSFCSVLYVWWVLYKHVPSWLYKDFHTCQHVY